MLFLPEEFELDFNGSKLAIRIHTMNERKVFEVNFPDERKPLMITRMVTFGGKKMWTSIPEGRPDEALQIGAKIVEYFKNQ